MLRTSSRISLGIGSVHLTQEGRVASTSRGNLFRFSLVLFVLERVLICNHQIFSVALSSPFQLVDSANPRNSLELQKNGGHGCHNFLDLRNQQDSFSPNISLQPVSFWFISVLPPRSGCL